MGLLYDILIVVVWVGLWGITESLIDKVAKDNPQVRFIVYIIITIVSIFFIWILGSINNNLDEEQTR